MSLLLSHNDVLMGEPASLGSIHVGAPSDPSEAGRLASEQLTVIPVESAQKEGKTLPDVLSEAAGVQVKRFGGLESFSLVSIHGTSPNHVRFYLDGMPLSQNANGFIDLSRYSLAGLERIEIYKGSPPIRFVDAPMGGVVNLVTKRVAKSQRMDGALEYGSFGTLHSRWGYGRSFSKSGLPDSGFQGSVDFSQTAGNFSFLDDNGTPFNAADDERIDRQNNDSREVSVGGRYETWHDWGHLDFFSQFFLKHQGVPGLGSFQSTHARYDSWRHLFQGRYSHPLFQGRGRGETSLFYSLEEDSFKDPLGEIGLATQQNRNKTLTTGLAQTFSLALGRHGLETTVRATEDFFLPKDVLHQASLAHHNRTTIQWGVQDEWTFCGERLSVVPSIRLEEETGNFHYAPALRLRAAPFEFLYFKAGVSRGYRVPSFFELYGDRGITTGNPDLLPETSLKVDGTAGLVVREVGALENLTLEINPFQIGADQLILFEQNSQRTVVARNASSARIRGSELLFSLQMFHHFKTSVNYTYQHAVDTSNIPFLRGNILPGRPVHELSMRAETYGNLPWGTTRVFYEASLLGENFLDRANLNKVNSRAIHNVGMALLPRKWLSLNFEVKNLTNNQVIDVIGYPLPGRSYFGNVTINLGSETLQKETHHETVH